MPPTDLQWNDHRWQVLRLRCFLLYWRSIKGNGTRKKRSTRYIPAFMDAGLENARLGIIYLFGNCKPDRDILGVVLGGGLSVTGAGLGFADLTNPTECIQAGHAATKKVYFQGTSLPAVRATFSEPSQSGQKKTITEENAWTTKKPWRGLTSP